MQTYCLDGTNLVRGSGCGEPAFDQEDADTQWLLAALGEVCRRLEGKVEVELFFDGAARPMGDVPSNLSVRFSHEVSADELILDRVRSKKWNSGGVVTVVTGDSELGRQSEEEGGRWQKVKHGARLEGVLGAIERRFIR